MPKSVLVVGAGHEQIPLLQRARDRGLRVYACDGNSDAPGRSLADEFFTISTRDAEGVARLALRLKPDGVTSWITETALEAMRLSTLRLGLAGPSERATRASLDKAYMRRVLGEAGIRNPPYAEVHDIESADPLRQQIGFPMVVKPLDSSAQRGVTCVRESTQLEDALARALGLSQNRGAIAEAYIPGPELNIVAVYWKGHPAVWTVSERQTYGDAAFGIVSRHLYPARWGDAGSTHELLTQLGACLEIDSGVLYPQVIWHDSAPVVVELGFRVPGGKMKEVFEYATGYDLLDLHLDLALGQATELEAYRKKPGRQAVVVRFVNGPPGELPAGLVKHMGDFEAVKDECGLEEIGLFGPLTVPLTVRPLRSGLDRFIYIIATGDSREEALSKSERAVSLLDVVVEAP